MRNLVNKVQLIGHLGRDVEVTEIGEGKRVAKTTLATNSFYRNKAGDRIESTDWHFLVAWGKTAERLTAMGRKGIKLLINGRLSSKSYENKEGIKKYVTEIVIDEFMVMSPKAETPF